MSISADLDRSSRVSIVTVCCVVGGVSVVSLISSSYSDISFLRALSVSTVFSGLLWYQ